MIVKNAEGKYFELKEKVLLSFISATKYTLLAVLVPVMAKVLETNAV